MKLKDCLTMFNISQIVSIGAGSSYVYIGEAGDTASIVKAFEKASTGRSDRIDIPILEREVVEMFERVYDGIAIVIEGTEMGRCWTRNDYILSKHLKQKMEEEA